MDDDFEPPLPPPAPVRGPPPSSKRSFFSKPAVAAAAVEDTAGNGGAAEDATDFFRQSRSCFGSIMQEQERKKQRRLVRKLRGKAAWRGSDEELNDDGEGDEDADDNPRVAAHTGRAKRQRISDGSDGGAFASRPGVEGMAPTPPRVLRRRSSTPGGLGSSPPVRGKQDGTVSRRPVAADVIELGDSSEADTVGGHDYDNDSDDLYAPPKSRRSPKTVKSMPVEVLEVPHENQEVDDTADDDEYSELIARARERNRQRELKSGSHSLAQGGFGSLGAKDGPYVPPDPPVSVLISSTIEGTKPLIIRIYLSKKIGELLKTWTNFNEISDQQSAEVILVWRRLVQWRTTTLRRMLQGVVDFDIDGDGTIVSRPGCKGDGLSDDFSRIHLVATTNDGLAELKREHQRALRASSPGLASDGAIGDMHAGPVDAPAAAQNDDNVPITLKEQREYGELKIKVKRDTTIKRIITAFRTVKKVPKDKLVALRFDGEELNPDDMVQDTEIEKHDTIEVYVR